MADKWDKKVGTYDRVNSDYLTPEPHAHNIQIDLEIEVYTISYNWGIEDYSTNTVREFSEPWYRGNLEGKVTSANFSIDSTSDMRTSGSLSIILDKDSIFIPNADNGDFWQHVWLKVTKKYSYPNDVDMYPMYHWGDHIGLWNMNGLYASDPSQAIIGWFVPNSTSFSYNAETRELSISCTDILSFYTDSRGGHLSHEQESLANPDYEFWGTADEYDEQFLLDQVDVANYSNGMLIEGQKNNQILDLQYDNYFAKVLANYNGDNKDEIAEIYKKAYENYKKAHQNDEKDDDKSNFELENRVPEFTDTDSLVRQIVADYGSIAPIRGVWSNLQNGASMIPYDMEFNGDTVLYDVLKKITDLYPRQTIFIDTSRILHLEQYAVAWHDIDDVRFRAREFYELVLEEQWNVNMDNIKNFTVVWGRDNTCYGYYYVTSYQAVCEKCGKVYEYGIMPSGSSNHICKECGGVLHRLHTTNETYSVQRIGTHKQVLYDDNILTKEEAFNTAKWKTIANCRGHRTLTVTLVDRYLSMYQYADKCIGRRIEYKSHLTNETDVYTVLKWTNNFNDATVTLELEPYRPIQDEYIGFRADEQKYFCVVLPEPKFECTVGENGLMTMIINNGWQTAYSLFKIYYRPTSDAVGEYEYWNTAMDMDFLGETCEVYEEETETECQKKVFRYQFTRSGRYMITCQAWSPNIKPSGCVKIKVIEVDLGERYISENNEIYVDENDIAYV